MPVYYVYVQYFKRSRASERSDFGQFFAMIWWFWGVLGLLIFEECVMELRTNRNAFLSTTGIKELSVFHQQHYKSFPPFRPITANCVHCMRALTRFRHVFSPRRFTRICTCLYVLQYISFCTQFCRVRVFERISVTYVSNLRLLMLVLCVCVCNIVYDLSSQRIKATTHAPHTSCDRSDSP